MSIFWRKLFLLKSYFFIQQEIYWASTKCTCFLIFSRIILLIFTGEATHSSILAWRIPWTEEPGGLQSMDHKEMNTIKWLILSLSHVHLLFQFIQCFPSHYVFKSISLSPLITSGLLNQVGKIPSSFSSTLFNFFYLIIFLKLRL